MQLLREMLGDTMLRILFIAFLALMAAPSYAQEQTEAKTVATVILYEKVCEQNAQTADVRETLIESAARNQKVSKEDILSQATGMANLLASMIQGEPQKADFCAKAKSALAEAFEAEKPARSDAVLSNKAKMLIEFAIIFAIGAAIGWIVGFVYKRISGNNVNATRFWIPAWGIGFILLARVLVVVANS